jgi:hypothetical protein
VDNDCVLDGTGDDAAHPATEKLVVKIRRLVIDILKIL